MIEILGWVFLIIVVLGLIQAIGFLAYEVKEYDCGLRLYLKEVFSMKVAVALLALVLGGWLHTWAEIYEEHYNKKHSDY
ncbi:hypothetical protein A2662_01825 [Candidatus Giovannonibacteria bacterium RIFCSPHIGHO2_01_FULL_45_33]|uniref:Uncharacterized protein n=1 Tax=Candidatus Giovannonibacteria bacterium RIFCSPLOWO2_01_FULL_45_34 TaxID=1798351 RepID=A0A1F5WYT1_9BACT|nr:MAG: hypothetical protein A2662_01825 [Candidatus Giovannonibacteria bacterium RIFCSPHIGHO2_01_FULL_45_33]OGF70998.1 MAG: hypothetical protein A3C73_04220 [Candidatus Giovannonibacteria bacterium RIFCSPHIGHO2_02_FULL_44_11]OGF80804.1 MAG: hypothetical protein A2930_01590 [Candidatus Giovannonibacteria bacterium RIFCSPLOWO2_01_FULL_45_34]